MASIHLCQDLISVVHSVDTTTSSVQIRRRRDAVAAEADSYGLQQSIENCGARTWTYVCRVSQLREEFISTACHYEAVSRVGDVDQIFQPGTFTQRLRMRSCNGCLQNLVKVVGIKEHVVIDSHSTDLNCKKWGKKWSGTRVMWAAKFYLI
jgi:hypothetical protein